MTSIVLGARVYGVYTHEHQAHSEEVQSYKRTPEIFCVSHLSVHSGLLVSAYARSDDIRDMLNHCQQPHVYHTLGDMVGHSLGRRAMDGAAIREGKHENLCQLRHNKCNRAMVVNVLDCCTHSGTVHLTNRVPIVDMFQFFCASART